MPSLRRRLVEILYREHGFTQQEISEMLGLSQPAVSKYLSGSRGFYLDVSIINEVEESVKHLASLIAIGRLKGYSLELELARIVISMLGRGYACQLHAKLDTTITPYECGVCKKLFFKIS